MTARPLSLLALLLLVAPLVRAGEPADAGAAAGAAGPPTAIADAAPVPELSSVWASGVPQVPEALRRRLDQYLEARAATLMDVSDDGRQVLISTRFANTSQLHVVEMPLGARTQLTFGDEPILRARFGSPDGRTLFYLQDTGGGEFYQVYRLDRRSGRSELLTDGKSRHEALLVSADGRWLAYSGTGRNGKDTDVYVAPVAAPREARRVTEAAGSWYPLDVSPDGKRLLVMQFRAVDDSDAHVVNLESGERVQVTPREGKGSVTAGAFARDGRGVFLATDRWGDFAQLYRFEPGGAPPTAAPPSLSASLRWNVVGLVPSPDGRRLALAVNEEGYTRVYLLDVRGGSLRPLDVPRGVLSGEMRFARRRPEVLALSLTTPREPQDVYTVDTRAGRTTRWTRSEVGGLDTAAFVEPELVRYPSRDGIQVPAFLYRPRHARGRVPVVVLFHGGPEAQNQPYFSSFVQFLTTELGFAVLMPNVRGSEGYGKAFRAMDDGVKREASLADIGATLDWVASREDLDPARVGVYGGSYGGYMVLCAAAFYPERIRAAVDVVGISSIPTFLENTQAYRRDLRRAEYGDERDPQVRAVQERISPLSSAARIQAALFVQQGKNDPRVPQSEAEQIVQAVRGQGREVWYALALDEGHGFAKKHNRDFMLAATALFLDKHLGAPPGAAGVPAPPGAPAPR